MGLTGLVSLKFDRRGVGEGGVTPIGQAPFRDVVLRRIGEGARAQPSWCLVLAGSPASPVSRRGTPELSPGGLIIEVLTIILRSLK